MNRGNPGSAKYFRFGSSFFGPDFESNRFRFGEGFAFEQRFFYRFFRQHFGHVDLVHLDEAV